LNYMHVLSCYISIFYVPAGLVGNMQDIQES
jgi:hypothetical protein